MKMSFMPCFVVPCKKGLTASGLDELAIFVVVQWRISCSAVA